MKPGWQTSEFWLSLGAVAVGALQACGAFGDASWEGKLLGMGASVLGAMGYTVSRTWLKGQ
jgi:hypothetical protein